MCDKKQVIIVTSRYKEKYFLNEDFKSLPQQVKDELVIMSVKFVNEIGGILEIGFDNNGSVYLSTMVEDDDLLYDEIGSELLIKRLKKEQAKLFSALEQWYQLVYLKKN